MKRNLLFALLLMVAGIQTAWGQRQGSVVEGKAKVSLYVEGSKAYECDVAQLDSIVFSETPQNQQDQEIIVTVDANGNADGGHWFEKIDETNFYIDDIKYTAQNGDLVVTGYNNAFFKGAATIISKLKYRGREMDVVKIEKEAFKSCTSLTSVTIPNSVTRIGEKAFSDCSSLTSITIPNSVTSIGNGAFLACSNLKKVIVPDIAAWCAISFEDYDANPLYCAHHLYSDETTEITNLIIPNSVTSIGDYAFRACSSLTSITIPNSVTSIGDYAFRACSSLTSITIPNSVTTISDYAFSDCSNLTSITIPNSVTSIGNGAFYNSLA